MRKIKGIPVLLHLKTVTGTDRFGAPVYAETPVQVENVLVGEPTTDDIVNEVSLSGKRIAYTLAIPKKDTHTDAEWKDTKVEFFGRTFHTFGDVTQGIDTLIPLDWNRKVKVEEYE